MITYFISYQMDRRNGTQGFSNMVLNRNEPIKTATDIREIEKSLESMHSNVNDVTILFFNPIPSVREMESSK